MQRAASKASTTLRLTVRGSDKAGAAKRLKVRIMVLPMM
jgi:head-tail adaptor